MKNSTRIIKYICGLRIYFTYTFTKSVWLSLDVYKSTDRMVAGLGGSFGCAVRPETRRLPVLSPPRSATFFRGD